MSSNSDYSHGNNNSAPPSPPVVLTPPTSRSSAKRPSPQSAISSKLSSSSSVYAHTQSAIPTTTHHYQHQQQQKEQQRKSSPTSPIPLPIRTSSYLTYLHYFPMTLFLLFLLLTTFLSPQSPSLTRAAPTPTSLPNPPTTTITAQLQTPQFTDLTPNLPLPFFKQPLPKYGGPCIADINRDGIYDLLLSNHNKAKTMTYFGMKQGNNNNIAYRQGGKLLQFERADVHGISVGDTDMDGLLEVVVTRGGGNGFNPVPPTLIKRNINQGNWNENYGKNLGINDRGARGRAAKLLDVDGDGDLDLLLINEKVITGPGPRQIIYENVNGKFIWKGTAGDLGQADGTLGQVVDFDGDGILDLILGHKLLFLKGSKQFIWKDVTKNVLQGEIFNMVMAIAEIDIDNDGDFDLYLARGWGKDDKLLENVNGKFVDITNKAGLPTGGGHRNMVTVGDFNNDGYMDVFLSRRIKGKFGDNPKNSRLPDLLLLNNGKKGFKVIEQHGAISPKSDGAADGAQAFDFDNDGRLDILSSSEEGSWRLFRNISPKTQKNKYLLVRVLMAPGKTATSMGALVTLHVGTNLFRRRVGSAGSKFQQSQLDIVHFGLGAVNTITKVVVKWSNGQTATKSNVQPNTMITFGQ